MAREQFPLLVVSAVCVRECECKWRKWKNGKSRCFSFYCHIWGDFFPAQFSLMYHFTVSCQSSIIFTFGCEFSSLLGQGHWSKTEKRANILLRGSECRRWRKLNKFSRIDSATLFFWSNKYLQRVLQTHFFSDTEVSSERIYLRRWSFRWHH